jgi:hypothetical protein
LPARLIGDKAYDSDRLAEKLEEEYGIELIAPNRGRRGKTQDGRPLRRYKMKMESGAAFRLDAQLSPTRHPMGISHRELLRLRPPRLPSNATQALMRLLLASKGLGLFGEFFISTGSDM